MKLFKKIKKIEPIFISFKKKKKIIKKFFFEKNNSVFIDESPIFTA
jgi:hypothetical protein